MSTALAEADRAYLAAIVYCVVVVFVGAATRESPWLGDEGCVVCGWGVCLASNLDAILYHSASVENIYFFLSPYLLFLQTQAS